MCEFQITEFLTEEVIFSKYYRKNCIELYQKELFVIKIHVLFSTIPNEKKKTSEHTEKNKIYHHGQETVSKINW